MLDLECVGAPRRVEGNTHAFHGAQLNQSWYARWNPNNPQSPLNLHKDGSVVSAQVESVSFFKRANAAAYVNSDPACILGLHDQAGLSDSEL